MAYKVWNGSAWQNASNIKVYNGSTFVSATSAKIWDGSSWVQFYPDSGGAVITNQYISVIVDESFFEASVGYSLVNNGVATTSTISTGETPIPGEWLISGNVSDYEVRWTLNNTNFVGTLNTPDANTWLSLNTARIWSLTTTALNSEAIRGIDVNLRHSNGTVLANAYIQFQAIYGIPP
jgi:hypothetical protein